MSTFRQAIRTPRYVYDQVTEDGVDGFKEAAVTISSLAQISLLGNPGTPVWDRDWDVLLILDACRIDLMEEVVDEYSFLGDVDTHDSVASKSPDWIRRTFSDDHREHVDDAAYVTGNPFTEKVDFREPRVLDEVWKYAWDDDLSTVPARPITDRAIATWRDTDAERMIVHYMQPHVPFVPQPELGEYGQAEDFGRGFDDIWGRVGDELSYGTVWQAYRDNLHYVLADVELLLSNLNADTVAISADHGNAIGEWGVYGHPPDRLLPVLRDVPWVETTATDTGEYQPSIERQSEDSESEIEERLRDLGYR